MDHTLGTTGEVSKTGRMGVDFRVSNPGGGRDFAYPFSPTLGPPIQWVSCLFPGVRQLVRAVDNPPLSSAEVNGRIALKTYAPTLGLHCLLQGRLYLLYQGSVECIATWTSADCWPGKRSPVFPKLACLGTRFGCGK